MVEYFYMENIIELKNLSVEYKSVNNKYGTKIAVDNVSLAIQMGEIYALAGESGCGKTTLSKAIIKLIKPSRGEILYKSENIYSGNINKDYSKQVQMIFQNPHSSLNPKMKIYDILKEPLDINTRYSKLHKKNLINNIVEEVGLSNNALNKYPHEFSGGQKQRIAIARALILNPDFLIADEPVSALDASIQAQIINLLTQLKKDRNLTILFISHDLNVIRYISDRIGIMYNGCLIEENKTSLLFSKPKNEYTKKLLSSSPLIKF